MQMSMNASNNDGASRTGYSSSSRGGCSGTTRGEEMDLMEERGLD